MTTQALKRTAFYDLHVEAKAKMVPFAGFEMPVHYQAGITEEHDQVRTGVGVFDVSHMGEFEFTGPDRNAFVNRLTCNDFGSLDDGQAQYTALLTDEGTFVDDCVVYRFDDKVMLVVNAANIEKDWEHVIGRKVGINVRLKNISDDVGLLAVQGPNSEALVQSLTSSDLTKIGYYRFDVAEVAGVQSFVSRTGYTGEDGFELYFRVKDAEVMWRALVGSGRGTPCGLGARDTLRLEMGYALYGNEIDETINPYEAGMGWLVKLGKGVPFVGKSVLMNLKAQPPSRRLVGFVCSDVKAIPRRGYAVLLDGNKVDIVRSGGYSPSLKKPIGTTYLPYHSRSPGTKIEVAGRGKRIEATAIKMPFFMGGSAKKKS